MNTWQCKVCNLYSPDERLLRAPSPFDPTDTIVGCPHCKSTDGFDQVCDEPGCTAHAHCGWPSDAGYRRTCGNHMRVNE